MRDTMRMNKDEISAVNVRLLDLLLPLFGGDKIFSQSHMWGYRLLNLLRTSKVGGSQNGPI